MSTFKFGEIRADVDRLGPDPKAPEADIYKVRITSPDNSAWMESRILTPRRNRTVASDFDLAIGILGSLDQASIKPRLWRHMMKQITPISDEELDATMEVAQRLKPYLPEAMEIATQRYGMFSEARESGVGPYDPGMGISRKLEIPESVRTKEDIARFFAYLYLVDRTSFHPDDRFGGYVDPQGKRAYTRNQAATRDKLMRQSWKVANANGLDIYEVALWVGALTGASSDPENEADAPDWLKGLSNTWI